MVNRTALVNQIRGILLEYGVAISKGVGAVRKALLVAEVRWSALVLQFFVDHQSELQDWDAKSEVVTAHVKRRIAFKECVAGNTN